MKYSIEIVEISSGFSIYIPDSAKIKDKYEELLAINPLTPFPFWAKLWASSYAMVDYLKSNPAYTQDKKVIELGAGIGLPSLVIASQAKKVLVSDHDKDAVELMKKNIEHLGLQNIQAELLDWNKLTDALPADTLLLSDINYAPEQFAALETLIKKYLAQGTQIIIATPQRIMGANFVASITSHIQQNQTLEVLDPITGAYVTISLLIL
jgi:predicted nicotinamide N-methyase